MEDSPMEYRKLGRTDVRVSEICLGTMTWGCQNTEAQGHAQMDYALSHGVNFFDTAEMYSVPPSAETYGRTEEIIGSWFAERKSRDKIILASKVAGPGLPWVRGGNYKIDRKNILAAIEGSLRRLRTDYIDLYQLHWTNRPDYQFDAHWETPGVLHRQELEENFIEVLETLEELVRAGKIRHAGLSNETAWGTMKYLRLAEERGLPRMVSIQNEYSLLCRLFDWDLAEVAGYEDIGLLAWSPLATGMISGKYLNGERPKDSRWHVAKSGSFRDTANANAAVREYIEIARKYSLDVCQMAIAFVLGRPFVTSAIIGATSMPQLESNIGAAGIKLDESVIEEIEKVRRLYPVPY